jgi:hypothetical protein
LRAFWAALAARAFDLDGSLRMIFDMIGVY